MEPCSAPAISQRATTGQCVAAYGKNCKEIQLVNPKRNQSWIFIGRTDAQVETSIIWPPDVKNQLIGKDPDAREDWRREEKGTTEDEMAGWHHRLSGHEFVQYPGVGDGQGSLVCCSPWRWTKSDMTEPLISLTAPLKRVLFKSNFLRTRLINLREFL